MISKTTKKLISLQNPKLAKSLKDWEDQIEEINKQRNLLSKKIEKIRKSSFNSRLEEFILCCREEDFSTLDNIENLVKGWKISLLSEKKFTEVNNIFIQSGFRLEFEEKRKEYCDDYGEYSYEYTYHNVKLLRE